jgi:hypothetical protein
MENNGTSMCLVYIAFGYLLETFLLLDPILLIFDDFSFGTLPAMT